MCANISCTYEGRNTDMNLPLLAATYSIFKTDYSICLSYREPETHQESLDCTGCREWRRARGRRSMPYSVVVPTPPSIRPIKSRYVYKRKHNKDSSVKKICKARLVALDSDQMSGVDVFTTFLSCSEEYFCALVISTCVF